MSTNISQNNQSNKFSIFKSEFSSFNFKTLVIALIAIVLVAVFLPIEYSLMLTVPILLGQSFVIAWHTVNFAKPLAGTNDYNRARNHALKYLIFQEALIFLIYLIFYYAYNVRNI